MNNVLVVEGHEYKWLMDMIGRLSYGEPVGTLDDLDAAAGILERTACCDRCERVYNEMNLAKIGYEKKGGV